MVDFDVIYTVTLFLGKKYSVPVFFREVQNNYPKEYEKNRKFAITNNEK